MARRRPGRDLSQDDLTIWKQVAQTVTPLHAPGAPAEPAKPGPKPLPVVRDLEPVRRAETAVPGVSVKLAPETVDHLRHAAPRMDRRNYDRLTRGKLRPERRIDLHGMTAAAAHGALRQFLIGAHAEGVRVVLVITGKGRMDHGDMFGRGRGVIRHALPVWLDQEPLRSMIVQAVPAAPRDGGSGAFYLYLRRNRGVHA